MFGNIGKKFRHVVEVLDLVGTSEHRYRTGGASSENVWRVRLTCGHEREAKAISTPSIGRRLACSTCERLAVR